jgi:hypothetical protein
MNQGIAFARTIRALDADDFGRSKLTLVFAAILLGAWTWWMLAARLPQYETTTNVRLESGRAIAYFSSTDQIRPGQTAFVTLGHDTVTARVQNVTSDHAELVFTSHQSPATISTSATAEIEISRISPAAIALRTLGRAHQ